MFKQQIEAPPATVDEDLRALNEAMAPVLLLAREKGLTLGYIAQAFNPMDGREAVAYGFTGSRTTMRGLLHDFEKVFQP